MPKIPFPLKIVILNEAAWGPINAVKGVSGEKDLLFAMRQSARNGVPQDRKAHV